MTVVDGKKFLIVSQAKYRPQKCVAYPQIGSEHEDGYFDTGKELLGVDPHGYVSVLFVKHAAEELGWHSPEKQIDKQLRIDALEEQVSRLEDELKSADKQLDAVHTLRSERWKSVQKTGPKSRKGEE